MGEAERYSELIKILRKLKAIIPKFDSFKVFKGTW